MTRPTQMITATITGVAHIQNSADGNPRFRVTLDTGGTYDTEPDAAINHGITNSEYREGPVMIELATSHNLIRNVYLPGSK